MSKLEDCIPKIQELNFVIKVLKDVCIFIIYEDNSHLITSIWIFRSVYICLFLCACVCTFVCMCTCTCTQEEEEKRETAFTQVRKSINKWEQMKNRKYLANFRFRK